MEDTNYTPLYPYHVERDGIAERGDDGKPIVLHAADWKHACMLARAQGYELRELAGNSSPRFKVVRPAWTVSAAVPGYGKVTYTVRQHFASGAVRVTRDWLNATAGGCWDLVAEPGW